MEKRKIALLIPASVVSDTPHLREKTAKIGLIGRAAAIFGVNEIILYPDVGKFAQNDELKLISTLLRYMETPQYLRKQLFRLTPELQYAGILPPLRIPSHPLIRRSQQLRIGEYREGIAVSHTNEGTLLDIGVEKTGLLPNTRLPIGKRATFRIRKLNEQAIIVRSASYDEVPVYWGYRVTVEDNSLGRLLKPRKFDVVIAASKYGRDFIEKEQQVRQRWQTSGTILIVFGSPTRGLREILKEEKLHMENVADFSLNMIPHQRTETVRTEEAILITLAIFNISMTA